MTVPQAAIDAAAAAIERELMSDTSYSMAADSDEALARAALEAAAPLIAAAERERIRQLAEKNWAVYTHFRAANVPGERRPFAELLAEGDHQ